MSKDILTISACKVNTVIIISNNSSNFDKLKLNDLLEIIKILLDYIMKYKKNKDEKLPPEEEKQFNELAEILTEPIISST